ncbi:MAG: hypothetical protein V1855_01455, partial [bacterium]
MNIKKILLGLVCVASCWHQYVAAFAPTSFFRPYDSALRLADWKKSTFKLGVQGEYGDKSSGKDWDAVSRNVLALHDEKQSTLAMIKSSNNQEIRSLKNLMDSLIGLPALDEDTVGLLKDAGKQTFTGDFNEWDINISAGYKLPIRALPGTFALCVHIPIIRKEIQNVSITDLTKNETAIGRVNEVGTIIKNNLTTNLKTNVKKWGNLDLSDWDQTGVGDIVALLTWYESFRQDKEYLKNVNLHAKLGVSVPTGEEKDEDRAFSMP